MKKTKPPSHQELGSLFAFGEKRNPEIFTSGSL
ncbi:hypothetical protein [Caudoviricetes sp.]|nr:hypothetical protein [Caudoviricetes sp.]